LDKFHKTFEEKNGFRCEVVTGKEADDLIAAVENEERARRPWFAFFRTSEFESETVSLAGRLFIDMPKKQVDKKAGKKLIQKIFNLINEKRKSGEFPFDGRVYGWHDRAAPFCSDEITENDEIMSAWAANCVSIVIRGTSGDCDPDYHPIDSGVLSAMGLAPDGSALN
jgi:hypothetical protein